MHAADIAGTAGVTLSTTIHRLRLRLTKSLQALFNSSCYISLRVVAEVAGVAACTTASILLLTCHTSSLPP